MNAEPVCWSQRPRVTIKSPPAASAMPEDLRGTSGFSSEPYPSAWAKSA
jgi:hypothetical protein